MGSSSQAPDQPPLPQPPHSQHHGPPIIFLVPPVRIAQDQRREPKARGHPSGDGDAGGVKGRKDVDERQQKRIAPIHRLIFAFGIHHVAVQVGSVRGADEAQLVVCGRGEQGVDLIGQRFPRSDEDGDGAEEEEEEGGDEAVDGNETGHSGREEGQVDLI